jgi:hypothetical protein
VSLSSGVSVYRAAIPERTGYHIDIHRRRAYWAIAPQHRAHSLGIVVSTDSCGKRLWRRRKIIDTYFAISVIPQSDEIAAQNR